MFYLMFSAFFHAVLFLSINFISCRYPFGIIMDAESMLWWTTWIKHLMMQIYKWIRMWVYFFYNHYHVFKNYISFSRMDGVQSYLFFDVICCQNGFRTFICFLILPRKVILHFQFQIICCFMIRFFLVSVIHLLELNCLW